MQGGKEARYDVVVIGSGSAGMSAAFSARDAGARVLVVEREKLGGECPNWACVPSKALLRCAKAYRHAKEVGLFGVKTRGIGFRFEDVMRYRGDVVTRVTGGGVYGERYEKLLRQAGIDVARGLAHMVNAHTVQVGSRKIEFKALVVASGTKDFVPPIDGLAGTPFWGFRNVMELKRQPKSLIVLGGGPVGCELATFFVSFGTRVTIVQGGSVLLDREDAELSALATKRLEEQGVVVFTNAKVSTVSYTRNRFRLAIASQKEPLEAEALLVATGKRPAIDGLGLEKLKLNLDARGYLAVDDTQASSVLNVFGAGDVTGGMQLTHVAHVEGAVAGYNAAMRALGKTKKAYRKVDLRVIPHVTFLDVEVASVGLVEADAKKQFKNVLVGRFQVGSLGRAVTDGSRSGFVKLVAEASTGKLVGGHIIADRAGEMIHEVALAIKLGAKMSDLAELIHAFPTYSEAISAAASNAKRK